MRYAIITLLMLLSSAAQSMVINELYGKAQRVVYELPEDADRVDAVKSIEAMRDRFFGGKEIIDAAKTDDAALKEKLTGDFILYTTLDDRSRLFKAAAKPLPVKIEEGRLRWGEVNVPTSDLRVIMIGKNPFGEGRCIIYSAGTNKLLTRVHSVFHGGCSYHIYQGEKLVEEGSYNEKFQDSSRLTKDEAIEDVRQFFLTMQRVHPDLLAKVDAQEYIELKKRTSDGVSAKLDNDGRIAIEDLAYLLYYAAAYFGDGHTSLQWQFQPNESNSRDKRFPPFQVVCENGRFLITDTSVKDLQGLEIVSINGKAALEFLKPILDRCSGETLAFKAVRFTNKQAFWYSFSSLFGSDASVTLKLKDSKGRESERKVETVGLAEFQKLASNGYQSKHDQLRSKGAHVTFLDSDKIAYFFYPQFNYSEDEKKKIDGIFKEIKAKGSRDLIMDIRGNGGGHSGMGDFIFTYLHEGKFCSFSKVRVRLSEDVMSSVAKDWQIPKEAEIEGVLVNWKGHETTPDRPEAFFKGRTYLLTDNSTFSSATDFTAMFRDYKVGKIMGYETGGVPNCFGDVYTFSLKNSGIPCGVSWKQFFGPIPKPGDDEHGVLPDIPMTNELLKPYQDEDDPGLAFAIDKVRKGRK